MNSSSTVSAELGLRLVVPKQTIVPLVASLFYSKEDPYAIRIAFHVGLDEPVEWIFARDLLSLGIEGREGLGDVVVWPSAGSADGAPGRVLNIELSSPFGQAHFEAPIKELADFLEIHALIHDHPVPLIWLTEHTHPPTELRIDKLRKAAFSQAGAVASGSEPVKAAPTGPPAAWPDGPAWTEPDPSADRLSGRQG